jgi:hypothetical protein
MTPDTLTQLEYEALRAEERDRMNGRAQVWTLYLTIVGAFGLAALQGSSGPDVVALCPLVLCCLARHSRHNEDVLRMVRKYLYQLEVTNNYQGYEHFTRLSQRPAHGGYRAALRDAFLLTDALSTASVLVHLWSDHAPLLVCLAVLLVDLAAIGVTWRWLSKPARKKAVKRLEGKEEEAKR